MAVYSNLVSECYFRDVNDLKLFHILWKSRRFSENIRILLKKIVFIGCHIQNLLYCRPFNSFVFQILVQEVQAEGRYAIDSPGNPNNPEIPPEDYALR